MKKGGGSIIILCLALGGLLIAFYSRTQTTRAAQKPEDSAEKSLSGQVVTLLPNGLELLSGGEGQSGVIATAELKDPNTGITRTLPHGLLHARAWHTSTVLPDGTVLIFGGVGANGQVEANAESFDPATEQFINLPTLGLTPRAYHTATVLTDGRVLIAGGLSESGETLDNLEFWDYRTRTTTGIPAGMLSSRSRQTATLLSDGTVLFWGGVDRNGQSLDFGEIFDPVTESSRLHTQPISTVSEPGAPFVEASIPQNGSTDASVDASLSVRFSKPMNVSTVNGNTVSLSTPQGEVQAKVVAAEDGMLAFVTPVDALLPGTSYSLTLSGAFDSSGNALQDTTITFKTAGESLGGGALFGNGASTGDEPNANSFNSPFRKLPPLHARPGETALAGQVLRLSGLPLPDVTLSIGSMKTTTDRTGRFLLTSIPTGHQVMSIDGSTASYGDRVYGFYEDGVDITANQTSVLSYTIWMTQLDVKDAVTIPSPTTSPDTVITTPRMPGLELHLRPDTTIYDHNWAVSRQISITPIPVNQPPFPLPQVQVPVYFTIQPGGGYVQVGNSGQNYEGARLIYPNTYHLNAGTPFDFWNYDAAKRGWYIYGHGKVSADGRSVIPDPGVEIYRFTGAMVGVPGTAPSTFPPAGDNRKDGEPVNLSTGLFVYNKTDLVENDVIPLVFERTYRTNDGQSRPFGIGATDSYELFTIGDTNPWTYQELILPDGSRIHFDRISSGTSYTNAVYMHATSNTKWYGATISWDPGVFPGESWVLKTRDGTSYYFPEAENFNDPARQALLGIRDRYGNTVTITRDSNGNVTQITSPNGRYITFQHDSNNRITQAQDNIGQTVAYTYDSSGRLATVTDANGGTWKYTYDSNNNMLTIQDARGIVYLTNQYDSGERVLTQTLADGSTYQFAWTPTQNSQSHFLEGGGIGGGSGEEILTFRNCAECMEGYMPLVSQVDVTDPNGNIREVKFDADGYTTSDTYAKGTSQQQTFTYTYYADNLLQSMTDPLGRTTDYTEDANGNLISITRLAGTQNAVTSSFSFDPTFSQLTSSTDPLSHTTTFAYDNNGNLLSVTDPLNNVSQFTYDSQGQPLTATDPLNHATQFTYDSGDLVSVTDPLGRTTTRFEDAAGRLISVTNPLGQLTKYIYDNLNQISSVTDPLNGVTSFSYDPNGNLLSVTDANSHATSYTYDNMDRLATRKDALGNTESYQYDHDGNLTEFTDRRGEITTYTYDALNRRTFAGFGTQSGPTYESTIGYTYDAGNRLTQAVDSVTGTITRGYDGLDRLTSETTPQGSVSYAYDAASRRTSMTVAGQTATNYSYDNANRLTGIAQGSSTVSFAYDAANRRTSLTLPNGIVMSYSYDGASELTGIGYQLAQTSLGNITYSYDLAGRRTSMGGSLAAVNLPNAISTTAYNANNQLTQWGTATPTYDANGNTLSDGTNTYVWNARNQLVSMNLTGESYQYDPFGRRVSKTILGTTTNYLYDGANPVQELSGTTPTANMLTGGTDEYFTRTDSTGTANFLTDALGSTVALTNSSGSTIASYTYEPFGNTTASGSSTNTYQYVGRENDGTGVYFYRNRYYAPALQRFIAEDPTGFGGGINFYAYALDDPVSFVDPYGLDVTVTAYPGAGGNPFGHAGVSVNGAPPVGFNPAPGWDPLAIVGLFTPDNGIVPGAVLPITPGRPTDPGCLMGPCTITIHTTPQQDQDMLNYIKNRTLHPGYYQLFGRNCATFVHDVLKSGGVPTPDTPFPRSLVNNLQNQYWLSNYNVIPVF